MIQYVAKMVTKLSEYAQTESSPMQSRPINLHLDWGNCISVALNSCLGIPGTRNKTVKTPIGLNSALSEKYIGDSTVAKSGRRGGFSRSCGSFCLENSCLGDSTFDFTIPFFGAVFEIGV